MNENPKPVLVVGSSNTDMVIKSKTLPAPGVTVTGGSFLLAPGGKGANQAVAAARQGAKVVFAAKVGDDLFGEQAVAGYQAEGIDTQWITREKDCATGIALILVDEQGENLISVASGANFAWTADEVEKIRGVIASAAIVVMQLEIPLDAVSLIARLAASAGVPVLLDPAPAVPLDEELLQNISILKPNEHEATVLSGIEVRDEASAIVAAQVLLERGVRDAVIITLGSAGAVVFRRNTQPQIVKAPKIEAADTTAAGDAFTGALASQLARGVDLLGAVRQSNLVAALSATKMGAQPSLPTVEEVRAFEKICQI